MKTVYSLVLVLCFCLGCGHVNAEKGAKVGVNIQKLIGATVAMGIESLHLTVENNFIIEEPPRIPRGIEGVSPKNEKVYLYVARGAFKSQNEDWKLDEFLNQKIIGIAVLKNKVWRTWGNVIPYFHFNVR